MDRVELAAYFGWILGALVAGVLCGIVGYYSGIQEGKKKAAKPDKANAETPNRSKMRFCPGCGVKLSE